ncbi:MAG: hypothetical protein LBH58_00115 [Tannerellaceae bacterium]|jgi:hypothetical protein|nr:hypothetical protein [Tannerellaceae bacterium]
MKHILLFFSLLLPFCTFPQSNQSLSGTKSIYGHSWEGDIDLFTISETGQLQFTSPQGEAGEAFLLTSVPYNKDLTWELDAGLDFKSTNSNNLRVFVYKDDEILYYIQVGNNKGQVSFYTKEGERAAKLCIKGREHIMSDSFVSIRLTLEKGEQWTLYTRTSTESTYYNEGSFTMTYMPYKPKTFMQLTCRYVKSRISCFYIDNINIETHAEEIDKGAVAELSDIRQISPYELQFIFTAPVDISKANCRIEGIGEANRISYNNDTFVVNVRFNKKLEEEQEYYLEWDYLYDMDSGKLIDLALEISFENDDENTENPQEPTDSDAKPGELIFNELLPNPFTGGSEYIELYNCSERNLSLKGLAIAVRKADGSLQKPYPLSEITPPLKAGGYALLSKDIRNVSKFYFIASPEVLFELKIPVLANTSSTLVLFRMKDEVVIDEVNYSSQWHASPTKDLKGIALERIDPNGDTQDASGWTSATAIAGYGTPGYQNSQYKQGNIDTHIEPPVLTPDGLYQIIYQLNQPGYYCKAHIYNLNGYRVAEIANNELLGTAGKFLWDGKGIDGLRIPTGLYIINMELYNDNGAKIRYKKPFLIR